MLDRGLYFRVISKMRSAEGPQRLGSFKLEIEDDLMFSEGEEEQLQDTSGNTGTDSSMTDCAESDSIKASETRSSIDRA